MQADTAKVSERPGRARSAVERHTRRRHVRVPGTLYSFRFRSRFGFRQLPVSAAMPRAGVVWTVERRRQFLSTLMQSDKTQICITFYLDT